MNHTRRALFISCFSSVLYYCVSGIGTTFGGAPDPIVYGCDSGICEQALDLSRSYSGKEVRIRAGEYLSTAYITKPEGEKMDAVFLLHGTANTDAKSKDYAQRMPATIGANDYFSDRFLISVAYKETNVVIGDDLLESEAVFLTLKNAKKFQNVEIGKMHILWHSRGGYIALKINSRHANDGIIVNGPWPMDIAHTCEILLKNDDPEVRAMRQSCAVNLAKRYGDLASSRAAYDALSVRSFICESKSPILFIQGWKDKPIQIEEVHELTAFLDTKYCSIRYEMLQIDDAGHWDTFERTETWQKITSFIGPATTAVSTPVDWKDGGAIAESVSYWIKYAQALAEAGIIGKKTKTEDYRLLENITRAEMAKVVINLARIPIGSCRWTSFTDVGPKWGNLCSYVESAAKNGIVLTGKRFRPNDFVTRAEAIKMILKAKWLSPIMISQWFLDPPSDPVLLGYVNAAASYGIIGKGGYLQPNREAIRGIVFAIAGKTFWFGQTGTEKKTSEVDSQETLRESVASMVSPHLDVTGIRTGTAPGMAIGIVHPAFSDIYGFGVTTVGSKASVDKNSVFAIGSISKLFTGLVLAKKVRAWEIALSESVSQSMEPPLRSILPESLTFHRLVTHTSGLKSMPENIQAPRASWALGYAPWSPARNYERQDLANCIRNGGCNVQSGAGYSYSNLGIGILATALEDRFWYASYGEMLDVELLQSIGMKDTGTNVPSNTDGFGDRAVTGYAYENSTLSPIPYPDMGFMAGAWEILSTGKDMTELLKTLAGNNSGVSSSAELACQPLESIDTEKQVWYAISMQKSATASAKYFKAGGTKGFSAFILWKRQPKIGVVILTNKSWLDTGTLPELAEKILAKIESTP